jgi:hypothetical protein
MGAQTGGFDQGPIPPEDLEVTLAVRNDLGPDNDRAVIAEFLDRVGSTIDARVDARVSALIQARIPAPAPRAADRRPSIALGVVSIVSAIPITAIVLGTTHASLAGIILLIVAWVAIAAANLAQSRRT